MSNHARALAHGVMPLIDSAGGSGLQVEPRRPDLRQMSATKSLALAQHPENPIPLK